MGEKRRVNDKFTAIGANIVKKVTIIWNVVDTLRDLFKSYEYG